MANKGNKTDCIRSSAPEPAKAVIFILYFIFRSHAKTHSNEIGDKMAHSLPLMLLCSCNYDMTHIFRKSLSLSSNSRALFIGIDLSSTFGKYGE